MSCKQPVQAAITRKCMCTKALICNDYEQGTMSYVYSSSGGLHGDGNGLAGSEGWR